MIVVAVTLLLVTVPIAFVGLFAMYAQHCSDERENIQNQWCDLLARVEEKHNKERHDWALERAALLERIQRPEYKPPAPIETKPVPDDSIRDDLHLVGQVVSTDQPPAA